MTYHYENRFIMKDDEGKVVQDIPWNPDETSIDALQCTKCKTIIDAQWPDEECLCTEDGKPDPPRDHIEVVHCDHCSEYIPAHDYINHLGDCMSY